MTIIDRFEGEYAVCEQDDQELKIPRVFLPKGAREGDCLVKNHGGDWTVDRMLTLQRRQDIAKRLNALYTRNDDPEDIT